MYIIRIIETLKSTEWERFVKSGGIKALLKKLDTKVKAVFEKQYIKSVIVLIYKSFLQ